MVVRYERAIREEEKLREIINKLGLSYIDVGRVRVIYSFNSRSRAIARIWCVPRAILEGFNLKPIYVIELIWEKYSKLDESQKIKVLIHELLHIPFNFSGGLRPHGKIVNEREVERLFRKFMSDNV
jgi:predicted metallopeptidase